MTKPTAGDYPFCVRATDPGGNSGAPAPGPYTMDTTGPTVTITSAPSSPGNNLTPSWSFTTEAGATTECRLTGPSGVVSAFSACTSPASYDLSSQPDGDYTFDVRATDAVGNTGPVSSDTYTLDTTGPPTTITASPSSPGNDTAPAWSFTTEAGATTECRLDDSSGVIDAWAPCASPTPFDRSGPGAGEYPFSVRAT